jgi:hypothetical protein
MTSCDSVSTNLGEGQIRLNSFNESKLDLNQAFKPPKLTAKAPRSPSQRRRQEARGAAIPSLILSPKSREPRKTRNTRKQGIREIRGQSSRFFHFAVFFAPLLLCAFAFQLPGRESLIRNEVGRQNLSFAATDFEQPRLDLRVGKFGK